MRGKAPRPKWMSLNRQSFTSSAASRHFRWKMANKPLSENENGRITKNIAFTSILRRGLCELLSDPNISIQYLDTGNP